jgi:hypothetical protein
MAVCDANWDSGVGGASQDQPAEVVRMSVDHVIGAILFHRAAEARRTFPRAADAGCLDERSAGSSDSVIQGASPVCINQQILPDARRVGARQQIDQPRFRASAVHLAGYMQDANRAPPHVIAFRR